MKRRAFVASVAAVLTAPFALCLTAPRVTGFTFTNGSRKLTRLRLYTAGGNVAFVTVPPKTSMHFTNISITTIEADNLTDQRVDVSYD